jgi:hypothetical protein
MISGKPFSTGAKEHTAFPFENEPGLWRSALVFCALAVNVACLRACNVLLAGLDFVDEDGTQYAR